MSGKLTQEEVNRLATPLIRKYDWHTEVYGYGIRLTITDGVKQAGTVITGDEDIEEEIKQLIAAVDRHEYGEIE